MRLGAVSLALCNSPNNMRGTPGCAETNSIWVMNTASSAARGVFLAFMALSTRASKRSETHSITACQMASLLEKCRNSAPWVKFMCLAMADVVISPGFCSAERSTTASTVTARRSSAGKCLFFGCIPAPKDSN